MFENVQAAKEYVFAGRGIITLRSVRTGVHFTYKLGRPKDFTPGSPLFVSVLTDGGEYRYFGMLDAKRKFRLTAKSTPARDAKAAAAFRFCVDNLNRGCIPDTLEISHEGRCGCCERLITTPSSLASGIGPECLTSIGGVAPKLKRQPKPKLVDPIVAATLARAAAEYARQQDFWRAYRAAPAAGLEAILDRFAAVHCR